MQKVGYVDLLDIQDPEGKARTGASSGVSTVPFATIENVDVVDTDHIVVANDNKLPFPSGRTIGRNDDNEFILLRVPEFMRVRGPVAIPGAGDRGRVVLVCRVRGHCPRGH